MTVVLGREPAMEKSVVRPPIEGTGDALRIHYLDNLRALAMTLGVFLHGAFAYAYPAQTFWLATDRQSSAAVDAIIWFIHLFRMGLFFLISGYFGKLVVARSGVNRFLRQRIVRLVFPFLLFYPFLLGSMSILIAFGLSYVDEPKGLMGLIAEASKQNPASNGAAMPGTIHLWFLYYLFFFTLLGAAAARFPYFSLRRFFQQPWQFAMAPLALLPGIIGAGTPLPSPESFAPAWWPFAFYGLFYYAGWQMHGRENRLDSLQPYLWHIVGASLLLFVPYYVYMPKLDLPSLVEDPQTPPVWRQGLLALLTAYLSVALTLAAILLGRRYLSWPSSKMKFAADASYWVYLIHLPIVLFLQTLLIPFVCNVWIKISVTLAVTFFFCLATYVVFVRYTPLGGLLHGKRSFP